MKGLIAGAALALAAVFGFQSAQDDAAHSQDSRIAQGVERMDSVLQKGLSEETHDKLAKQADSSAEWLKGFSAKVQAATD